MIQIPKTVVIGLMVGAVTGGLLFMLSFLMAFGICSDTSFAEHLFPFALIVDPSLFERPLLALVLSVVQYPAYGMVLGLIWRKAGLRVAGLVLLLVIHLVAMTVASGRVATMWQQRFSKMNQ